MSEQTKKRVSLTLDDDAVRKGERLAKEERRSLSNMVEVLFEREYQRLYPNGAQEELPLVNGKSKAA